MKGICYLVGAGPGDPGLLTIRAKELIESAEVLIYDALVSPSILQLAGTTCEKIFVGKRSKNHALKQEEINALLVEKCLDGKQVVRLKGGDPVLFGRGAEEAAHLTSSGIGFEIVPGISSALAGPIYAGIPVTHRDHASQVTIFTGHENSEKSKNHIDYQSLAAAPGTKVMLMGAENLGTVCREFLKNGASEQTPVAVIQWATTGGQKTVVGNLQTIEQESIGMGSPSIVVFGDVVKERENLAWFEKKPLFGKKIVVTRSQPQAGQLAGKLARLGAEVLEFPTIRIEYPDNRREFAEGIANAHTYDWLAFSSPNGVERFFDAFFKLYKDVRSIGGCRIAAIGPSTAEKIEQYHLSVDVMPEHDFVAEGLIDAFKKQNKKIGSIENETILWVRAADCRDVISQGLAKMLAIVDECIAYKTVPETSDPTQNAQRFSEQGADYVVFTSTSCVENFAALNLPWPKGCQAVSIGPVTSKAIKKSLHRTATVEASRSEIPALIDAILSDSKNYRS